MKNSVEQISNWLKAYPHIGVLNGENGEPKYYKIINGDKIDVNELEEQKVYSSMEAQTKLNGFYYNTAALLNDIEGVVKLDALKRLVKGYTEDVLKMGGTEENAKIAMFRTCNLFSIEVGTRI